MLKVFVGFAFLVSVAAAASSPDDCTACHDVLKNAAVHEAAVFGCDSCHVDHDTSTNYPSRLKAPVNQLCLDCHDRGALRIDAQGRGHIVNGHPTQGARDPLYPAYRFTCASCHNPHSSNQKVLFRYNYLKAPYDGTVCSVCHPEAAIGYRPPTPPWAE